MNAFIFVSIICVGQACEFFTSTSPITEKECAVVKQQFLALPYKPEVTLAAAQCTKFKTGVQV